MTGDASAVAFRIVNLGFFLAGETVEFDLDFCSLFDFKGSEVDLVVINGLEGGVYF